MDGNWVSLAVVFAGMACGLWADGSRVHVIPNTDVS